MGGGRGKGGPAVDNAINAHVDDKINHLIQIATEFKIRNDQRRKASAPLLSYPTLYLLRLTGTKRSLEATHHTEAERAEYFNSAMAKVFPGEKYPGALKVITDWTQLTQDIIQTSGLLSLTSGVRSMTSGRRLAAQMA